MLVPAAVLLAVGMAPFSFADHVGRDCEDMYAAQVHLNHTIANGTLTNVCSSYDLLYVQIETRGDGILILDVPLDVFDPSSHGRHDAPMGIYVASTIYFSDLGVPYQERRYVEEDDSVMRERYERYVDKVQSPDYKGYDRGLTIGEFYDVRNNGFFSSVPEYYVATKIRCAGDYDRYELPFRHGDYLLSFRGALIVPTEYDGTVPYLPEKYAEPIRSAHDILGCMTERAELPCRGDLIPITKTDVDRTLCVRPDTAKALEDRGWILAPY